MAEDLRDILKAHNDPLRSLQRLNVARGDPNDYIILQESIDGEIAKIRERLLSHVDKLKKVKRCDDHHDEHEDTFDDVFAQLVNQIKGHQNISEEIRHALVFKIPSSSKASPKKTSTAGKKGQSLSKTTSVELDEEEAEIDENETDDIMDDDDDPGSQDFRVSSSAASKLVDWNTILTEKWTVNPK